MCVHMCTALWQSYHSVAAVAGVRLSGCLGKQQEQQQQH